MITIDRSTARRIWEVLCRAVSRRARGPEPTVFLTADRQTITVRVAHAGCTVEFVHSGDYGTGRLAVQFNAGFAALVKNQGELQLGEPCDDKVLVRWHDGVVPQNTSLEVRTNVEEPAIQEPARWVTCASELPIALAEARKTTSREFSRFATQLVCLRGSKHEVAATDGRQLLRWGEFRFPWTEDLLVTGPPAFDAAELRSQPSWEVGRTDEQVVFRAGPWKIAASIEKAGRFPNVDAVTPTWDRLGTRLSLNEDDAEFLRRAVARLPGHDEDHRPVTVDLNGHVGVRASDGESRTELILSRSSYKGKALSLVCNREYLRRAAELGFRDIRMADDKTPIVAHDRNRIYLFIPLTGSFPAPRDGAVTIDSAGVTVPQRRTPMSRPNPLSAPPEPPEVTPGTTGQDAPAADSPLGMAIALRDHYRDGCRRANELVQVIRLQRKQTRLVETTLASLRELRVGP